MLGNSPKQSPCRHFPVAEVPPALTVSDACQRFIVLACCPDRSGRMPGMTRVCPGEGCSQGRGDRQNPPPGSLLDRVLSSVADTVRTGMSFLRRESAAFSLAGGADSQACADSPAAVFTEDKRRQPATPRRCYKVTDPLRAGSRSLTSARIRSGHLVKLEILFDRLAAMVNDAARFFKNAMNAVGRELLLL